MSRFINAEPCDGFTRVTVSGTIEALTAAEFLQIESDLSLNDNIELIIDSEGGCASTARRIYELLKEKNTICTIKGVACSAAQLLSLCAKKIRIFESGQIMIHAPSSVGVFNAREMVKKIKSLHKITEEITKVISTRTKLDRKQINEWVSGEKDYWFTAFQAWQIGLVDEIIKPSKTAQTSATNEVFCDTPNNEPCDGKAKLLFEVLSAFGKIRTNKSELMRNLSVWLAHDVIDASKR